MENSVYDLKPARKSFGRIGLALFISVAAAIGFSYAWELGLPLLLGRDAPILQTEFWYWLGNIVPIYLFGLVVGIFILTRKSGYVPHTQGLGFGGFITALPICFFLMYVGNFVGILLSLCLGVDITANPVNDAVASQHFLKYVSLLICAPVFEELVFRKLVLDRTRHFGEIPALIFSAVCFSLYHMNMFQFFYAFGIGLVFGYVYLRTGRVRYTMIMHAILNFFGGVVATKLQEWSNTLAATGNDPDALMTAIGPLLGMLAVLVVLGALFLSGMVLFIVKIRRLRWFVYPQQLPKGKALAGVWLNVGTILFILLTLGFAAMRLF